MVETCEYVSIVKRAGQEGWLQQLTEAHAAPCTSTEALQILGLLRNLPPMRVIFRDGARGRARFSRRTRRYGMTLSSLPGGRPRRLRAGLVLHEAAHILAHLESGKFDHQERFCRTLRRLLHTDWRTSLMPTRSFATIFHRHRGQSFSIGTVIEIDHGSKRGKEQTSKHLPGPYTAEEAYEESRMLVMDPRENVKAAHVFGNHEGAFIGAAFERGKIYRPWAEELAAMEPEEVDPTSLTTREIADEVTSHPRVKPAAEPTKPATDWQAIGTETVKPKAQQKVPRRASPALTVAPGSEAKWPPAASAQHILATFQARGAMTAKEAAEVLAPKLTELGVAHAGSAVSRLKQAGLLEEVAA